MACAPSWSLQPVASTRDRRRACRPAHTREHIENIQASRYRCQMGTRSGPIHVNEWRSTLGAMKRCGTLVQWSCEKCRGYGPADLDALIEHLGPDANLWDRQPPCRQPGCDGRVFFQASPGRGTPMRPLLSGGRPLLGLR